MVLVPEQRVVSCPENQDVPEPKKATRNVGHRQSIWICHAK